uniref:Uncharacterized protein n=1 Tax=Lepeophtheirus salmonis TaxID=72036 RepID=A0A0K2UIL0_LEPSM
MKLKNKTPSNVIFQNETHFVDRGFHLESRVSQFLYPYPVHSPKEKLHLFLWLEVFEFHRPGNDHHLQRI